MAYTTIDDPSAFFQCSLYAGNAGTQTITHGGNSDLQADMVWLKGRNHAESTFVTDSVRGVNAQLYTNGTNAEGTETNVVTGFGSDSIAIGNYSDTNSSNKIYVSWNWKESVAAGMDIIAYTGNATGGRTVAHNLGAVPAMIICKNRAASVKWAVYHQANTSAPQTDHLKLNAQDATADDDSTWNDTAPTSSVFSVGGSTSTNGGSTAYIAYLFAEKKGYSKFGIYQGNGNADGAFIYTGFKPAFFMAKATGRSESWYIFDNKRSGHNPENEQLYADSTAAEDTTDYIDMLSNGIKFRYNSVGLNGLNLPYIFMAFAENPFATSTGIPATAR